MKDILRKNLDGLCEGLKKREFSSLELTKACFERIDEVNEGLNAFISLNVKSALDEAQKSDLRRKSGEEKSEFDGIPIGLKDNICVLGERTECCSKMLEGYIPPYSASCYKKLQEAGFINIGKLNMDEFAMGSTTENSIHGATKNPYSQDFVAGGSSGGSACAVAAYTVPLSLGSDTGGSVRQPASFCGVVGMKPTYGRVSRFGLIAFAPSFDQIGTFSRSVTGNAKLLQVISGEDKFDATSSKNTDTDFTRGINLGVKGLKIGIPKEFFGDGVDIGVKTAVLNAAGVYKNLGAKLVEISMPFTDSAISAYYIMSSAEASSNLSRFDGVRYGFRAEGYANTDELYKKTRTEGFGDEVKRRIMLGTFVLSEGYYEEYYKKALCARAKIAEEFSAIFEKCDVILTPTAPSVAYRLGEKRDNVTDIYRKDKFSVLANIVGIPALSVPCAFSKGGLPIGMQFMGSKFSEALLYRVAKAYEDIFPLLFCGRDGI